MDCRKSEIGRFGFRGQEAKAFNRPGLKETPQRTQKGMVLFDLLCDLRGRSLRPLRSKAFETWASRSSI
jgi:hypothetical protein